MLKVSVSGNENVKRILVGKPKPVCRFGVDLNDLKEYAEFHIESVGLSIEQKEATTTVEEPVSPNSHIYGMGERACGLNRKRKVLTCYNVDPEGYVRGKDPLTLSIPYYIMEENGNLHGLFVNSASKVVFDFGSSSYDKIRITVNEPDVEIFYLSATHFDDLSRLFANITGKPMVPPLWSFGHIISRTSYYPHDLLMDIIDSYLKEFQVSAVCLDIHYMDKFLIFSWDKKKYPDPRRTIKQLHDRGVKIITNVSPTIKLDQNFRLFREGVGNFVFNDNGEIFVGDMWPGKVAFPDFFKEEARTLWTSWMKEWIGSGIDGIWLDMNEPTILSGDHYFPANTMHMVDGEPRRHNEVRNAFANFEALATVNAFKELNKEPFVLSRAGFAGIQKYSLIWTGDNTASFDDLKLQISMVINLGMSGVPFSGCDLGGFLKESSPELVSAYYRVALFFPFFRNHKNSDGNDQELYLFPDKIKKSLKETIRTRNEFLPHLYDLALKAGETGIPLVKGLFQTFKDDPECYWIDDQYMLGNDVLYAPLFESDKAKREVYLPQGKWMDYTSSKIVEGGKPVDSESDYPIYIREHSLIQLSWGYLVFGTGNVKLDFPTKASLSFDGLSLIASQQLTCHRIVFVNSDKSRAVVDGKESALKSSGGIRILNLEKFTKIELSS